MINKFIILALSTAVLFTSLSYDGGSMAPVVLAGAIIKSDGVEIKQKYKRKDCPVCKGTGKYVSGDKITVVDCGYCEPEIKASVSSPIKCSGNNCYIK